MTRFGFVALVGRPNAGKSTLLNRLLNQKISIVSDKPQTTRNRIMGVVNRGEAQFAMLDLPGFHRPLYEMNKVMMQHVYDGIDGCDVVLYMVDGSEELGSGEQYLTDQLQSRAEHTVVALNKLDSVRKSRLLPLIAHFHEMGFEDIIPISALTGEGVDELMEVVASRLPEGQFQFDDETYTNITERFMVSEIVREKLLIETRDEIPYTTFVEIRRMETTEQTVEILCDIVVEKQSQKPIIIGRRGSRIGLIRKNARRELETYFEKPVTLELFVRVEQNWRRKKRFLGQLNTF